MLTKIGHAAFAPDQRVLVIVGDMLEKGWQNLETLRFVMHLSETGKVYTLIGNADTTLYNLLTTENVDERRKLTDRINGGKRYWSWTVWDE